MTRDKPACQLHSVHVQLAAVEESDQLAHGVHIASFSCLGQTNVSRFQIFLGAQAQHVHHAHSSWHMQKRSFRVKIYVFWMQTQMFVHLERKWCVSAPEQKQTLRGDTLRLKTSIPTGFRMPEERFFEIFGVWLWVIHSQQVLSFDARFWVPIISGKEQKSVQIEPLKFMTTEGMSNQEFVCERHAQVSFSNLSASSSLCLTP